jgi:hypothetical protein
MIKRMLLKTRCSGLTIFDYVNWNYTTIDGMRVGDSIDKVIRKYGTPEENVVDGKRYMTYWRKPYGTGGLIFEVRSNVVRQISFRFDPF